MASAVGLCSFMDHMTVAVVGEMFLLLTNELPTVMGEL